jgi:hypothetical protein
MQKSWTMLTPERKFESQLFNNVKARGSCVHSMLHTGNSGCLHSITVLASVSGTLKVHTANDGF